MCPNFGHPALTPSFTKYNFFQVKNCFATLVNELSVLKLFQLSNGVLLFSKHDYSLYKARKPRMTKLGHGVGVRAHYPRHVIKVIRGVVKKKCGSFSLKKKK